MTKYVAICPKCERFIIMPESASNAYCCNHLKLSKSDLMGFHKAEEADTPILYERIACKVLPILEVSKGENCD